jgi:gamma-glutamyltranspeptidase/glutathione hydrolase
MISLRIPMVVALSLFAEYSQPANAVSPPPIQARTGMVVTAQHLASEVGVDILKEGGNAVDAAVAVGYALAVVLPCCGNLGGGGFATLHLANGKDTFLNFREKAPGAATATMYLDAAGEVVPDLSLRGYKAVGIPGSVLGLDALLTKYGTMTRDKVMEPAIKLAEDGFVLTQADADILASGTRDFATQPNVSAIFLHDGKPWQAGYVLVQKDLAATLKAIAKDGPDALYKGPIADAVVEASTANGGIATPMLTATSRWATRTSSTTRSTGSCPTTMRPRFGRRSSPARPATRTMSRLECRRTREPRQPTIRSSTETATQWP